MNNRPRWARKAACRFTDYKPQAVTVESLETWLAQFPKQEHAILVRLLDRIRYFSEDETKSALLSLNERLVARLVKDGLTKHSIIYVQIGDAGSSSMAMLCMLRDAARLEGTGCSFLDSHNIPDLQETTGRLRNGAIVYVDDFSGTGNQFCSSHDFLAPYIQGNFSEFFLLPCICEEAERKVSSIGVEPIWHYRHRIADRPLHAECSRLRQGVRSRIVQLCRQVSGLSHGLGYRKMATMAVLYKNAPNTMPLVFRGNPSQDRYIGIFPRVQDLPRD